LPEDAAPACRWRDPEVLVCRLRVTPRAGGRSAFAGLYGDRLKVRVGAPPVDGKANAELLAFLAGAFGVPRQRVRLISGASGRDKTVAIEAPATLPAIVSSQLRSRRRE
jgi:uncharacterized protein (TIGR00251 family)